MESEEERQGKWRNSMGNKRGKTNKFEIVGKRNVKSKNEMK